MAENWRVIGFDIERHVYGEHCYPAQLVLQDVLTLHGSQFKDAALIVASPPCQEYSYMAMPWSRAKEKQRKLEADPEDQKRLNALFDACFRIQREACAAAGHHIPLVVENVRGAQRWVGRSRCHYGSFHLWGDVPALMPDPEAYGRSTKNNGGSWFNVAHNTTSGKGRNPVSGEKGIPHRPVGHWTNPAEHGVKQHGSGREWFAGEGKISRMTSSKSPARKAASAMIAKIPLPLARWIARAWKREAEAILAEPD